MKNIFLVKHRGIEDPNIQYICDPFFGSSVFGPFATARIFRTEAEARSNIKDHLKAMRMSYDDFAETAEDYLIETIEISGIENSQNYKKSPVELVEEAGYRKSVAYNNALRLTGIFEDADIIAPGHTFEPSDLWGLQYVGGIKWVEAGHYGIVEDPDDAVFIRRRNKTKEPLRKALTKLSEDFDFLVKKYNQLVDSVSGHARMDSRPSGRALAAHALREE
jgi:hypothetical protein